MKNLKKRLCGLLLTVAMLLSLCCPALATEAAAFSDAEGHWAEEIIQTLAADGIVNGCGDGKCHPDAPLTRGQFATLIARAMKLTAENPAAKPFADITGHWAADYVLALTEAGIILPADHEAAFEPDKEITRMEIIIMAVRAIGKESEAVEKCGQTQFADDTDIADTDSGYINTAADYGIIAGYPNRAVCPYQGASRAEGFCMLTRMLKAQKKLQENPDDKDDGKKPEANPGTFIDGGHSSGWSVPSPQISFTLPETAHADAEVTVSASARYASSVEWTLTKDGVSETPEDFTADGGILTFPKAGVYTLAAVATNSRGKTVRYERSITIYPVPTMEYSLPATAWTDTEIPVTVQTTGTEAVTIEWLVDNTYGYQDWNTYVDGTLTNNGGTIRFKRASAYELVARITDATGRVFLYESGAKCEVQPVLNIRFDLPEQLAINETADIRTGGNNNILPVEWSLTGNGQSVSLPDTVNGELNAYGGKISFKEDGSYTLTASMTDVLGRTFSHSRTVTVTPPPTYRISLPASCHIGTPFSVSAEGENLDGCTVQWSLTDSDAAIPYVGTLGLDGGEITVDSTGGFLLTAAVADRHGNAVTAQDEIHIINSAPEAPQIFVTVERGDVQNPYTTDCKVKVNITVTGGNDPDGDSIAYEYAPDSARTGYYGLGSYTVKVRSVDEWGEASGWSIHTFAVDSEAPRVALTSQALGGNASTTNPQVDFTAAVTSNDTYQLSAVDYYVPGSVYAVTPNDQGGTLQGQFSSGRHLMVVQAKNLFGQTGYASRFFVVGSSVGSETANITSLATTVEEKGIYDGATPLAYIERFTFDIPAISGHNTSCQDVVTVYGITANGTKETVLTFNTNNGYVHIDSNGSYEYTASSDTVSTASWSGWNGAKYTKLIFSYVMTSGHESCLNNATKGLSYTVGYSFIDGTAGNLENLFE